MALFSIEHGRAAYWADYGIYGAAVATLAVVLSVFGPREQWPSLGALVVVGAATWTLIEYALHRFVLHGLEPFRSWHAEHHDRPTALIGAPTLLSTSLIALLVFLPELLAAGFWRALALTLGLTAGYFAYALTHHATHHWRARGPWMTGRKRWHARHHHMGAEGCYGVTCTFWDGVFGSTGDRQSPVSGICAGEFTASAQESGLTVSAQDSVTRSSGLRRISPNSALAKCWRRRGRGD